MLLIKTNGDIMERLGNRMKEKSKRDRERYIADKQIYICNRCNKKFIRSSKSIKQSRKRRNSNLDFCRSCSAKNSISKKPQCSKKFWESKERKEAHSLSMKNSVKHKNAMKLKDISGKKNGMFGKKLSKETRKKMSDARRGKKQSISTINKRRATISKKPKKTSLNSRVKGFLHHTLNWYYKVYQRDGFRCTNCNSNKKIDAHHIKPLSLIIKEKIEENDFKNESEKYLFLISDEEIIDKELKNGITLCRECHKKIHYSWGSHYAK